MQHASFRTSLPTLLLACAFAVSQSACGSPPPPEAPAEPSPPAPPPPLESAPIEPEPEAAAPAPAAPQAAKVQVCDEMVPVEGEAGLIDDLEDADNLIPAAGNRGGDWSVGKDDKGSEATEKEKMIEKGGANKTKHAARMKGKVADAEGAWGANMALTLNHYKGYDASEYAGVSFYAKHGPKSTKEVRIQIADGQTVEAGGVCKQCWNHFGKTITLTPQWQLYTVSFAELSQQEGWGDPRPPNVDPGRLWQLLWMVNEKGAAFDIWVDQVQLMKCKE